ncbi:MAG: cold-shock protein [Kiritimatiellia bacterium]
MAKGIVKWFNQEKGFGFIEQDGSGTDVFVHVSQVARDALRLSEGDRVEFDAEEMANGLRARNICKLDLTSVAE